MNKVPHKHAALIKQWADGATIEVKNLNFNIWYDCIEEPMWLSGQEYRVKPEPKPDYIRYARVSDRDNANICMFHGCSSLTNVKLIFDGETGKIKSVELV